MDINKGREKKRYFFTKKKKKNSYQINCVDWLVGKYYFDWGLGE